MPSGFFSTSKKSADFKCPNNFLFIAVSDPFGPSTRIFARSRINLPPVTSPFFTFISPLFRGTLPTWYPVTFVATHSTLLSETLSFHVSPLLSSFTFFASVALASSLSGALVQDIITNNPASIDASKNLVLIVGFFLYSANNVPFRQFQ